MQSTSGRSGGGPAAFMRRSPTIDRLLCSQCARPPLLPHPSDKGTNDGVFIPFRQLIDKLLKKCRLQKWEAQAVLADAVLSADQVKALQFEAVESPEFWHAQGRVNRLARNRASGNIDLHHQFRRRVPAQVKPLAAAHLRLIAEVVTF